MSTFPVAETSGEESEFEAKWARLLRVRRAVSKALEAARDAKEIGASNEASVQLYFNEAGIAWAQTFEGELPALFIVADVTVRPLPEAPKGAETESDGEVEWTITVEAGPEARCDRCWRHVSDVGQDDAHPDLCLRCANVLSAEPTSV